MMATEKRNRSSLSCRAHIDGFTMVELLVVARSGSLGSPK